MDNTERILREFRTIAVVGLSRDPTKVAHAIPARMQRAGFRVIPVNPFAGHVLGEWFAVPDSLEDVLLPRANKHGVVLHDDLGGDREGDAVLVLRRLGDLLGPARLLSAEIVGGHADDDEPAVAKLAPQLLQAGILRGVAALRGGVDHEQRPAGEFGEADVAAGQRRKRERVSRDLAHGALRAGRTGTGWLFDSRNEGCRNKRPAVDHGHPLKL